MAPDPIADYQKPKAGGGDPFAAYQKPLVSDEKKPPAHAGGDPFAAYQKPLVASAAPAAPDFTKGKPGEGLYQMLGPDGTSVSIPYSNVMPASKAGYRVRPTVREWYARDRREELRKKNASDAEYQSMALPEALPGKPGVWSRIEDEVQRITEPTNLFPGVPTNLSDPGVGEASLNTVKRVGRDLFGIADFAPQAFSALKDALSADPKVAADGENRLLEMHPGAQIWNRLNEVRNDYHRDPKLAASNVAGDLITIWLADKAAKVPGDLMRSERLSQTMPRKIIQRLIKSGGKDTLFGKDPAQAILDHKIVGNDLRTIGDGVYAKLREVGQQIDDVAKSPANAGKTVDVSDVLKPLDDAIAEAETAGDPDMYDRLWAAKNQIGLDWQRASGPVQLGGKPDFQPVALKDLRMSPTKALNFKRIIGDRIRWTQSPLDGAVNETLGASYGIAKDALNKALGPEFAKLNEQYSDLVGAAKSIERQIPVEERGANWKLTDIVLGATGHPVIAAARMASHHPGVRSRGARFLYGLKGKAPGPALEAAAPVAAAATIGMPRGSGEKQDDKKPVGQSPSPSKPSAAHSSSPLADAISGAEGFGPVDKIPTLANNPGSLKLGNVGYGTMRAADGQEITIFGSLQDGKNALNKQLDLIFSGKSAHYSPDMTLEEFGKVYSGGDAGYGARIAASMGVDPSTTLGELRQTPAAAPLPEVKAEAAAKKPSPATKAQAAPAGQSNPPSKQYALTAVGPNEHWIGSDDGVTWFDIQTGQRAK
jgi:hypothetical protein